MKPLSGASVSAPGVRHDVVPGDVECNERHDARAPSDVAYGL
jgi:hypothetical protein